MTSAARGLAFYLPQFHPTEFNDREYGVGFTEWTDVRAASKLYRGHRQPVVPGALGYYDLRDPEVRRAQATMAAAAGIEGFVYWHYWSNGDRLLDRPFAEVLASGEPDFGFCLAWANHPWRRIGDPNGPVIFDQVYDTPGDDERHFAQLEPAFHDRRYLTVDGKPILVLFRPTELPDLDRFCDRWQQLAVSSGLPGLHIIGQARPPWDTVALARHDGLDGVVPVRLFRPAGRPAMRRLAERLRRGPRTAEHRALLSGFPDRIPGPFETYPCVVTNWDNTPRNGREGFVLRGSTPEVVAELTGRAVASVARLPAEHRLVFFKSWNEWAEGNYLEPDEANGSQLLDAVALALLHPR